MTRDKDESATTTTTSAGLTKRGLTSDTTTTSPSSSSPDPAGQSPTKTEIAAVDQPGGSTAPQYSDAEKLRQQAQRDETQAFLDQQEMARQQMATETKLREDREKKAAGKK